MDTLIGNIDLERIWKMMDEFHFQSTHKIPADYLCTLCEKLMNDARICQCGCRFCNKCITAYVSDGNSFCPGKSNECKDESLNAEVNIWIDHITNRRIGKVRVNCPVEMCSHNDCLMDIEEHVRSCASQSAQCPYSHIGCDYLILEGENVNHHLKSQKDHHIQIMIKKIENAQSENENLKNQIDGINNEKEDLQRQIQSLQDDCNTIQNRMEKEKRQLSLTKNAEVGQLNELLNAKEKEIDKYKASLNAYFDKNPKKFLWLITNWARVKEEEDILYDEYYTTPMILYLSETKLQNTISYSEEFYTHVDGYKMQLELECDDEYCRLYLAMIGGDYNTNLLWPVKAVVTAGVSSFGGGGSFENYELKTVDFNNQHDRISCFSFVLSDLTNLRYYVEEDILPIKCVVRLQV